MSQSPLKNKISNTITHREDTCFCDSGRSNALNIAARLGLDPTIVAAARQRLSAGVAAANEAIQELEVAQDELKQADLAAFAVEADVNYTKVWSV